MFGTIKKNSKPARVESNWIHEVVGAIFQNKKCCIITEVVISRNEVHRREYVVTDEGVTRAALEPRSDTHAATDHCPAEKKGLLCDYVRSGE